MMKISDWLRRVSTGWVSLVALVIFITFMALVLPGQSSQAPPDGVYDETGQAPPDGGYDETGQAQAEGSPDGTATPDLSFLYSVNELYEMAESYGEQGRSDYVKARFTFDLAWPMVYTFFLATAISWLFGKASPAESIWGRANLVPLLAMLLDYLENISTSVVMARYPARTPLVDALATIFTPVKWVLVGVSFVLLLIGILFAVWNWKRK